MRTTVGGRGNHRTGRTPGTRPGPDPRGGLGLRSISGSLVAALLALASAVGLGVVTASVASATAPPAATSAPQVAGRALHALQDGGAPSGMVRAGAAHHNSANPHDYSPVCTFNGNPGPILSDVTPGEVVAISCSGWLPDDQVLAFQISPLALATGSTDDVDTGDTANLSSDGSGNLTGSFTVPNPFAAADPQAVCPPTADQVASGLLRCGILMSDGVDDSPGYVGASGIALDYATVPTVVPAAPTCVGMASTPDGGGYWLAWSNGRVTTHGDAISYGDASSLTLSAPIAHIVATTTGHGYWLVAGDGGTFAYGDAGFYGSMGGTPLNRPVVDLAPTPSDHGYWLVASDGGIFAFGDAAFHGSMGGQNLNRPVVGISADAATGGYWEVASDAGIFAFGAPFDGSTGNLTLNQPINGMTATRDGGGYLFVASDGGIFAFGDAGFFGSAGNLHLNGPIVGMALDPATDGYWLVGSDGGIFSYNAPFYGAQ